MNILVTGAAGFIGSHLSENLANLGHKVQGLDCLTDYYTTSLKKLNVSQIEEKGVEFHNLDLAEDKLVSMLKDVDMIFHLAGQPGISATVPLDTYVKNNIIATHRLLEQAKNIPTLQGFVNISTSSVYGADATGDETSEPKPTSYYGVSKLAAEQLVLAYTREQGLPACSLRLFSVYGPRERPEKLYPKLIGAIYEGREFPLHRGSLDHLRSYTYIADIIDGMVAVLDNFDKCQGEIFNIGTDVAVTTGEGIKIVENLIGESAKISVKPPRSGDQLKTHANIQKARRILNYNPQTKLNTGLEHVVNWYKQDILGKVELWPENTLD